MTDLSKMTKEELIELVNNTKTGGRKEQVLKCLKEGVDTIEAIAAKLDINTKNVSSQLTYLRKDGHKIISISAGGQSILMLMTQDDFDALLEKRIK